ncbi:tumor necrosis factor alpha-induced protein 2 isoform X2 [Hemicordylus capensis]|nr:tumor necrosis factor alpha-induced protein 2 isoform X2 [Hemicordylus capensis]
MKGKNCRPVQDLPLEAPAENNGVCNKTKKGILRVLNDHIFKLGPMIRPKGKPNETDPSKEPPLNEFKPVTVDQIRKQIEDMQFFDAAQNLLDMKKGTYSNSSCKSEEEKTGNQDEIEALLEVLRQEVFRVIRFSIRLASADPELLQDAVRAIVELVKDERSFSKVSDSSQPGKWEEDWRKMVQASVAERMKEPPFDNMEGLSTTTRFFLHMGKTMKLDLIKVVQQIKPLYPEHFQVCSTYAKCYHHYFSSQLEMIAQFELGQKDTYHLLNWVQNLYPNEIKNHPDLVKELDKACLGDLLPQERIRQFEQTYVANQVDSVKCYLPKCLQTEVKNWTQEKEPGKFHNQFHSELPIDVIRIIYGIEKEVNEISPNLSKQMTTLLLEELFAFLQSYKKELGIYIRENKQHKYFAATIIANINNCLSFRTHTEKSTASDSVKEKIFTTLREIQSIGFDVLLQDLFQELQPLFKTFTQKKWRSCERTIDDIIATTRHHTSIFTSLKDPFREAIMGKIHLHLVREHLVRLMKKRAYFKTPEEQSKLSDLIQRNASILCTFCKENGSKATWLDSALPSIAEILKLQDTNAIKIEVGGLASRYPDISKKHLTAILYIKGNLSSSDSKSILSMLDIGVPATLPPTSLFTP